MTTPTPEPEFEGKPLSHWLTECHDNNTEARVAAINALGMMAATSSIPVLVQLLQDKDSKVENAAAEALGKIGQPAIPALLESMRGKEWGDFTSSSAFDALCKMGPAAIPGFMELIRDEKETYGLVAGWRLGLLGAQAEAAIPALVESLRSEVWGVRSGAAAALEEMGTAASAAVPAVTALLENEHAHVRSTAVDVLMAIVPDTTALIPAIIKLLSNEDDYSVLNHAIQALERIGPSTIPILIELLGDNVDSVRVAAVRALAQMGAEGKVALSAIAALSQDNSPQVRGVVADALGVLGSEAVLPVLTEMSRDKEWHVRSGVAFALRTLGTEAAIPVLEELLNDDDYRVQASAVVSFVKFRPEETDEAISIFRQWLQHENVFVRCEAVTSLRWLGTKAKTVLKEAINDPDDDVSATAARALSHLAREET